MEFLPMTKKEAVQAKSKMFHFNLDPNVKDLIYDVVLAVSRVIYVMYMSIT
jgi:hypothetical protein